MSKGLKPGWLSRAFDEASREVKSRPKWMQLLRVNRNEYRIKKEKRNTFGQPDWADDFQWLFGVGRYGQ